MLNHLLTDPDFDIDTLIAALTEANAVESKTAGDDADASSDRVQLQMILGDLSRAHAFLEILSVEETDAFAERLSEALGQDSMSFAEMLTAWDGEKVYSETPRVLLQDSAAQPPLASDRQENLHEPFGDDGSGGSDEAGAMGAGRFWRKLLNSVDRNVSRIDKIANRIDAKLDTPNLSESREARLEARLERLDGVLDQLDQLLNLIDAYGPSRFDERIDEIRERIVQERDDIDAILNPPQPVEPPEEDAPQGPVDETPTEDQPADSLPPQDPQAEESPAGDDPAQSYSAADFKGQGKTVVVIDTGWNAEFIGSDEQPVDEFDFYDTNGSGTGSAFVENNNDHGSWVDQVVRDVASGVDIIHLKVFPDGSGGAPMTYIDQALDWVIDKVQSKTYDISAVNLSLGYGNTTSNVNTSLADEFAILDDLGVFSVVAAGNSGEIGVQYLAASEDVIAVSASTAQGGIASFSQHHSTLTDIFAFGQSVRIEKENGGADYVSGTSFAAPYVSGVAARLQEAAGTLINRSLTDEEFIQVLQASGSDLSNYDSSDDPAGYHISNADAALEYLINNYQDF